MNVNPVQLGGMSSRVFERVCSVVAIGVNVHGRFCLWQLAITRTVSHSRRTMRLTKHQKAIVDKMMASPTNNHIVWTGLTDTAYLFLSGLNTGAIRRSSFRAIERLLRVDATHGDDVIYSVCDVCVKYHLGGLK